MVQEGGDFLLGEAQVAFPDLGHLASSAQLRQGQGGILARADDQVHRGGLMVQQEPHGLVDCGRGDAMVVVQHQRQRRVHRRDVVDQWRDQAVDRRQPRRLAARAGAALAELLRKELPDCFPDAPVDLLQRGDQVDEELGRVVVPLVQ